MTKREFGELPLLLTRKKFMQVTGLQKDDLELAVRSKQITPFYPQGKDSKGAPIGYAKYRKVDAARLAGLEI
jgi:hypothetical protein